MRWFTNFQFTTWIEAWRESIVSSDSSRLRKSVLRLTSSGKLRDFWFFFFFLFSGEDSFQDLTSWICRFESSTALLVAHFPYRCNNFSCFRRQLDSEAGLSINHGFMLLSSSNGTHTSVDSLLTHFGVDSLGYGYRATRSKFWCDSLLVVDPKNFGLSCWEVMGYYERYRLRGSRLCTHPLYVCCWNCNLKRPR